MPPFVPRLYGGDSDPAMVVDPDDWASLLNGGMPAKVDAFLREHAGQYVRLINPFRAWRR